jgi:surfactin synthase thioesterase subunit
MEIKNNPLVSADPTKAYIKIFCLHHAGGSSFSYCMLNRFFPKWVQTVLIDLPGRGKRIREPCFTNIYDMVELIVEDIFFHAEDIPYAIFGHSMGALLAYLATKKLTESACESLPLHLFLSGYYGPSVEIKNDWYLLPDQEFIKKVSKLGGMQQEIAAEKELMDFFIPIMKADFQSLNSYKYTKAKPFDIPETIFVGNQDPFGMNQSISWQETTTQKIFVKEFNGGHFFVFDILYQLAEIISQTLIPSHVNKLSNIVEKFPKGDR